MIQYCTKEKREMEVGRWKVNEDCKQRRDWLPPLCPLISIKLEKQAPTASSAPRFLLQLFVCFRESEFLADFQNFPLLRAEKVSFNISRAF